MRGDWKEISEHKLEGNKVVGFLPLSQKKQNTMPVELNKDCKTLSPEGKSSSAGSSGAPITLRERHMLAERERRKSMRELFLSLHSLLPNASRIRKEQSSILAEIIKYIPLAAAQLGSLQKRMDSISLMNSSNKSTISPTIHISDSNSLDSLNSFDCEIRVAAETSLSVAIRVRNDRVNISLIDSKGTSQAPLLLSAILDELEAHNLELVSSTHFRDGSKVLYHFECKISVGLEKSPAVLKTRLQELACKLHKLRKSSTLKRSFDQLD